MLSRQVSAEIPDDSDQTLDQEYQARDSNISKSFIGNDLDYKNYCLECKCIPYYWHLLFDFGLGQCYDTTCDDGALSGLAGSAERARNET